MVFFDIGDSGFFVFLFLSFFCLGFFVSLVIIEKFEIENELIGD